MGKLIAVTTVIGQLDKPALKAWANEIGLQGISLKEYVSDVAEAGTVVHEKILERMGGPKATLPMPKDQAMKDRVTNMMAKFEAWAEGKTFVPQFVEKTIECARLGFYGRPDWVGTINGVYTLLDIKSADALYEEQFLQMGAYQHLLRESYNWIPEQVRILLLGAKKPELPAVDALLDKEHVYQGYEVFQLLLDIYQARKPIKNALRQKEAA